MLKVVLMGTGPFAVPTFEWLRNRENVGIAEVVTRPVANSDGRSKGASNPVREWAEAAGLPIQTPDSINAANSIDRLRSLSPDLLVVCDYGQILSSEAIGTARLGGINLHGSLLPRHRGAAPVQWSILSGDSETGATVIHLTPKLDGGPILARFTAPILPNETAEDLEKKLSEGGVEAIALAIGKIATAASIDELAAFGEPQDSSLATKAPRLNKIDGQLDFRYPALLIERQVRGLQPWPGAYGQLVLGNGKEMRVSLGAVKALERAEPLPGAPGQLLWGSTLQTLGIRNFEGSNGSLELVAICQPGLLAIESLQPAGKRLMRAKEFLAGYGKNDSMVFLSSGNASQPLLEKLSKL